MNEPDIPPVVVLDIGGAYTDRSGRNSRVFASGDRAAELAEGVDNWECPDAPEGSRPDSKSS